MFSTAFIALLSILPLVVNAAPPPMHLSRRADDAQLSLALDPTQVQSNSKLTGQEAGAEAGQVPSLTSVNNFINFCLTQQTSITNGLQTKTGSCNPTIMGRIAATNKMPSSKFVFPKNTDTIAANKDFTIQMSIKNIVTGNFVNPATNYYAAPCQVDGSGTVIGHSHVVIEKIDSLASTTVTDPNIFAFFKGLNGVAANGILTADVTGGLAAGFYRMASINACANHQPVLGAVAQHGSFDDAVYFTVSANGAAAGGNVGGNAGGNAGTTAAAASSVVASSAAAVTTVKAASSVASSVAAVKTTTRAASTSAAAATTTSKATASAGAGTGAGAGTSSNLQTFTGALGGSNAPPITGPDANGRFTVNGNSFSNLTTAKQRSCDIQHNACANAANSSGNKGGLTQDACTQQQTTCNAA